MKCNAGADAGRGVLLLCVLAMILAVANHRAHSPPASAGDLITRRYNVNTQTFVSHLKHLAPTRPSESDRDLLLRFFKQEHVEMEKPAAVLLDEKTGKLIIRAKRSDQDKVEALVARIVS